MNNKNFKYFFEDKQFFLKKAHQFTQIKYVNYYIYYLVSYVFIALASAFCAILLYGLILSVRDQNNYEAYFDLFGLPNYSNDPLLLFLYIGDGSDWLFQFTVIMTYIMTLISLTLFLTNAIISLKWAILTFKSSKWYTLLFVLSIFIPVIFNLLILIFCAKTACFSHNLKKRWKWYLKEYTIFPY